MLVLSRRKNESVIIGGSIKIVVVNVSCGKRVSLGIEAPDNVEVLRSELVEQERAPGEERSEPVGGSLSASDYKNARRVFSPQEKEPPRRGNRRRPSRRAPSERGDADPRPVEPDRVEPKERR
ncbi:MAG: carbon storage regulator [Thermoguttaceae bacterium]|nr:carbon storage regulator [Thermoguttaceae bacterium]MBQ4204643.1 carbon storage regulator [Thermoguttaceae bacterium]MBQ5366364.1 carbon storage regulator [Thermoguttaceae bacterium]